MVQRECAAVRDGEAMAVVEKWVDRVIICALVPVVNPRLMTDMARIALVAAVALKTEQGVAFCAALSNRQESCERNILRAPHSMSSNGNSCSEFL